MSPGAFGMHGCSIWVPLLRCIVACFVFGPSSLHSQAQAQAQAPTEVPNAGATSTPDAATLPVALPDPIEQVSKVVFIEPELDAESVVALHEASLAQFALIRAEIVFAITDRDATLAQRMTRAETLANEHAAIAVFWIDAQTDGTWLLHMMDSESERVVIRPVDAAAERRSAAIEAIAVMVRESTRALITDEPLPEAAPPPPTQPPSTPKKAAARPWRLWLGYAAEDFAPEVTWQHCLALGASFHALDPFYGGVRIVLSPPLNPIAPIPIRVQRYPIEAALGYRYRVGKFALDGELGLSVDVLRNYAEGTGGSEVGFVATPEPGQTRVLLALEPRIRGELRLLPFWGVFVDLGAGILLNPFNYLATKSVSKAASMNDVILRPHSVRPVLEAGIAFFL